MAVELKDNPKLDPATGEYASLRRGRASARHEKITRIVLTPTTPLGCVRSLRHSRCCGDRAAGWP